LPLRRPAPDAPVAALLALPTVDFHSEPATRAGNPGFPRGLKLVPGRDTSARAVEWPIRIRASDPFGLDRFRRGFHVCSLCLIVWPFGVPTPGHLLWPLLTSAPSRPALLQVALYLWMTLLPVSSTRSGQLATALGLGIPVEPIRVSSSSTCTACGADLPR